jgi:hypothetical protein
LCRGVFPGTVVIVVSEAERLDLYNGMAELLGPERAEMFMSAFPTVDISELATKADLAALDARMGALEAAMLNLGLRLDRMFQTMVAGLFVIVAAMVGVMISV